MDSLGLFDPELRLEGLVDPTFLIEGLYDPEMVGVGVLPPKPPTPTPTPPVKGEKVSVALGYTSGLRIGPLRVVRRPLSVDLGNVDKILIENVTVKKSQVSLGPIKVNRPPQ